MNFEKILEYIRHTPQNTNENILTQIIVETFEENAVSADWNANEGEAGYVKNRTHYEAVEIVNEPLNITWDGNTEGLVSVGDLYKVSDLVLTDEQIKLGTINMSGGTTIPISERWDNAVVTEDYVIAEAVAFVRTPNVSFNGATFSDVGIYFANIPDVGYVSSLTTTEPVPQPKTVVHKLDKKYLPDDVGGLFKVNVYYDEANSVWVSDKTYAEIKAAEQAKMPIVGTFTDKDGRVFTLVGCDESVDQCFLSAFNVIVASSPVIYQIVIPDGDSVSVYELALTATATELT